MAEKKSGIGTAFMIGAAVALAAGGVVSYLKRQELKTLAEELAAKLKQNESAEAEDGFAEAEAPQEEVELVIEAVEEAAEEAEEPTVIVVEADMIDEEAEETEA